VVQHRGEQQRAQTDRDRRVRSPLEIADGHRARDRAKRGARKGDVIDPRGQVAVSDQGDRRSDEHGDASEALALGQSARAILPRRHAFGQPDARRGREEKATEGEWKKSAPRGERVADRRDVVVEGRVLGLGVEHRARPQAQVFGLGGGDRPRGHRRDQRARQERHGSDRVAGRVGRPRGAPAFVTVRRRRPGDRQRQPGRSPREADAQQRHGETQQASAALEADQ